MLWATAFGCIAKTCREDRISFYRSTASAYLSMVVTGTSIKVASAAHSQEPTGSSGKRNSIKIAFATSVPHQLSFRQGGGYA